MKEGKLSVNARSPKRYSCVLAFVIGAVLAVLAVLTVQSGISLRMQSADDQQRVVEKLSRILLPVEGAPTVERIEDLNRLQQISPEFYSNALEGDFVVVFSSRAVIYREDIDQIVNIAPILTDEVPSDDPGSSEVQQ